MAKQLLFICVYILFLSQNTSSQTLDANALSTNGTINAITSFSNNIYIGGSFSYIGKPYGNAIFANKTTGSINTSFPVITGDFSPSVKQIVSDGSGGFYLIGTFSTIGGVERNRIAKINSDGTLNTWNPGLNCNSDINAIAVSADFSTVYIGGFFTTIGATSSNRNRIAAINASTGNATSWDPGISGGSVNTLVLSTSNTIYVGGTFTTSNTIGANVLTRNRIAEINTTDNNATTWNPNSDGEISTIVLSGTNIYVGGTFTNIGGSARNNIARIPNSGNTVDSWNPNSDNSVYCIAISGTMVFVGGTFFTIGGITTNRLVALDANTNTNNAISTWVSSLTNGTGSTNIYSLNLEGSTLYVGGNFLSIGGSTKSNFASIDISNLSSFTVNSLDIGTGGQVNTSFISGTSIYIGGTFIVSGGSQRNNIASFNGSNGSINSWNPNANDQVNGLLISSDGLNAYVSGNFTSIGGQSRNRLAKISTSTGNADATWNPNADGGVEKIALNSTESTLFFYGFFNNINGATARSSVAAVSTSGTGTATAFSFSGLPNVTTRLISVAPGDSIVYFGYNSTGVTINADSRNFFCAVRASDGTTTNWNPLFNQAPFTIAYNGNDMYLGGQFTSVGGDGSFRKLAKFSGAAGWHEPVQDLNWNNSSTSRPNGDVRAIVYSSSATDPLLYISGSFSTIGATSRQSYAALKASDLTLTNWNLSVDNNATLSSRLHISKTTHKIYISDAANKLVLGSVFSNFGAVSGDASDPLPIKLLSFNGNLYQGKKCVELNWQTASEINNDYFEIERLVNKNSGFEKIAQIPGKTNSNSIQLYNYQDQEINNFKTIYYRLKQVDIDGKFEYSKTIVINNNSKLNTHFTITPNPNNGEFKLKFNQASSNLISIKIVNMLGQIVYQNNIQDNQFNENINLKNLPNGWYTVNIIDQTENSSEMIYIEN